MCDDIEEVVTQKPLGSQDQRCFTRLNSIVRLSTVLNTVIVQQTTLRPGNKGIRDSDLPPRTHSFLGRSATRRMLCGRLPTPQKPPGSQERRCFTPFCSIVRLSTVLNTVIVQQTALRPGNKGIRDSDPPPAPILFLDEVLRVECFVGDSQRRRNHSVRKTGVLYPPPFQTR